jgi:predicted MPP superfamily phosphohydrolase
MNNEMFMWFLLIWIAILALAFMYIGSRLIKPANLTPRQKIISWIILATIPFSQPANFFLRMNTTNSVVSDIFGWISYIGFGFLSLLLVGLFIRDGIILLNRAYIKLLVIYNKIIHHSVQKSRTFDPERRSFILNVTNMSILGASALFTGYGLYEARRQAILERITVPIQNLPEDLEGFTIAQFSDIHAGPTIKRSFVQSVVEQVNSLNADVIINTGDMVDGTVSSLRNDVEPLKDLSARNGVYFVTGNHEYYSGVQPWLEEMDRLGFTVLLNEHRIVDHGNASLMIAGVPDYAGGNFLPDHKSDPFKAISGHTASHVKILLAHQPKSIFEASKAGIDLQISGHTHGGQYIPWSWLVTLSQPYIKGLHRHDSTWIYVNRGTGYWGPPLRLGIPSEVTLFTLTKQNLVKS